MLTAERARSPLTITDLEGYEISVWWHGGLRFDRFDRAAGDAVAHFLSESICVAGSYAEQYPESEAEIKPFRILAGKVLDLRDLDDFERWMGFKLTRDWFGEYGARATMAHNSIGLRSGGKDLRRAMAEGYDAVLFYDTNVKNKGATVTAAVFDGQCLELVPRPSHEDRMVRGYRVRGLEPTLDIQPPETGTEENLPQFSP